MGKTYNHRKEEESSSQRSGKHSKHASGKKTGGMKALNSYVTEDYDLEDGIFDDDIGMNDKISIQHTKNIL